MNRRISQVVAWWAAMQYPRPEFMAPLTLQQSLNQPLRRIAAALAGLAKDHPPRPWKTSGAVASAINCAPAQATRPTSHLRQPVKHQSLYLQT